MRLALLALAPAALLAPNLASAQDPHAGHQMPAQSAPADPHAGHQPAAPPAAPAPRRPAPSAAPAGEDPHAGHQTAPAPGHSDPHAGHTMTPTPAAPATTDPHAGHAMPAAPAPADPHAGHMMPQAPGGAAPSAAQLPVGSDPAPPVIRDNAADRVFGTAEMVRARDILANEHGGARISKVMLNIAEYQSEPDGGGYRWDGEAWYGGDINRLVLKSEGEGSGAEGLELAEVQALYSRAIARYTDLQVGVRQDLEPRPRRTYATVGFETLFPYWFEVEGAAFVSDRGDLSARLEGTYDLRLTQRLILQPQAEVRFSAQETPELHIGSGLTHAELGLRLRYEIRREFAPYVGVSWERAFGRTADFARDEGEDVESTTFVVGLRAWF